MPKIDIQKTETRNDQIPLSSDDYKYIPNVIYSLDKVEYLKRAEHEDGEVLITKKNDFQGAARLSALESDSYKKVGASSASITPLEVTSKTSTDINIITDSSETFKNGK